MSKYWRTDSLPHSIEHRPPRPAPSHQSLQKRCVCHRETSPHHTQQSPYAQCSSEGASRSRPPTPVRPDPGTQRRCACHRETTPHLRQYLSARCRSEAVSRSAPARPAPSDHRSRKRCVRRRGTRPHSRRGLMPGVGVGKCLDRRTCLDGRGFPWEEQTAE